MIDLVIIGSGNMANAMFIALQNSNMNVLGIYSKTTLNAKKLANKYTMLTLSEKGLYLKGDTAGDLYPTTARNIADVSGAGDTVISIATMCLAAGIDLQTVAVLSNLAGGQVCESPGVVPVNLDLLEMELRAL